MLVFLEQSATTLPLEPPNERDRLGTTAIKKVTAVEMVSEPIDAARSSRVYVVGRVEETLL